MEGYGPPSYGDAFADVYDDWYPASDRTAAAVAALVHLAGGASSAAPDAGPPPVLELGCGTGRLCLPLVEAGLAVTGIDASEAMLGRLRAKPGGERIEALVGDMGHFELGEGRFELAFCAFNTFFNLATAQDQAACFATVARHLRPGGRFVLECFVPPPATTGEPESVRDAIELRTLATDRVVLRISRQDPASQTISGQHVELSAAGVRLRPWHLRYAPPEELDAMAAAAGLELEHRWSDWDGTPFDDLSGDHVSTWRRWPGPLPPSAPSTGPPVWAARP